MPTLGQDVYSILLYKLTVFSVILLFEFVHPVIPSQLHLTKNTPLFLCAIVANVPSERLVRFKPPLSKDITLDLFALASTPVLLTLIVKKYESSLPEIRYPPSQIL